MPVYVRRALTAFIAAVWLANGLFCKVLGLVPRHEQIVGAILGTAHAPLLTSAIGWAEVAMAAWVVSGLFPRATAAVQIGIVGAMNALEFVLVPDLLLWGRANAVFALLFMTVVAYHAAVPTRPTPRP